MALDPYIGEIGVVSFAFAPRGWALCDGSLLSRTTYAALYSLIGVTYGMGDGTTTFALPDLRGRFPVGAGQGPNLGPVVQGEYRGLEKLPLGIANLPTHTHQASFDSASVRPKAYSGGATLTNPTGAVLANPVATGGVALPAFAPEVQANAGLAPLSVDGQVNVSPAGEGQAVDLRNPGLGMFYIIALEGLYPSRG